VLLVFREQYYLERSEPAKWTDENPPKETSEHRTWAARLDACRGLAEIIVAKSRHGAVGTVDVQFDGPTTKFSNLASSGHAQEGRQ
jgi:replicative DNA helicase